MKQKNRSIWKGLIYKNLFYNSKFGVVGNKNLSYDLVKRFNISKSDVNKFILFKNGKRNLKVLITPSHLNLKMGMFFFTKLTGSIVHMKFKRKKLKKKKKRR